MYTGLLPLPVIDEPFKRVTVDIVGPLAIPSSLGKRFILMVVDYATRYLEAVALSSLGQTRSLRLCWESSPEWDSWLSSLAIKALSLCLT